MDYSLFSNPFNFNFPSSASLLSEVINSLSVMASFTPFMYWIWYVPSSYGFSTVSFIENLLKSCNSSVSKTFMKINTRKISYIHNSPKPAISILSFFLYPFLLYHWMHQTSGSNMLILVRIFKENHFHIVL